ncbi:hypothetical protein BdWA1_003160 [Babesia duncani]|uniref:Nucleolar pre-ribosomal-associated protein 1 C-terminal domain-containing protein n=1 Tax=Babesia duncani TaxID=323732 RepID=A0AAD9PIT1_9APIC|nr:hypothetical protein BdWA1_003160 [Babesia duncani]
MESIYSLNGVQIAECIVKRDFKDICPSYRIPIKALKSQKSAKIDRQRSELLLYRPFNNVVNIAELYVVASPSCVELFDVFASDNDDHKLRSLSLLTFIVKNGLKRNSQDAILDRMCNQSVDMIPKLFSIGDVGAYYILDIIMEIIKARPRHKVKCFIKSVDLYSLLVKYKPNTSSCLHFTIYKFYTKIVNEGLLIDIELIKYSKIETCQDSIDIYHCNVKRQLCILLLLGLQGFNILKRTPVIRFIFEQIKKEALIESICIIYIIIQGMKAIFSRGFNRLTLELPNNKYNDLPDFAISNTANALSQIISKIADDVTFDTDTLLGLNKLVVNICKDFISTLGTYGDVDAVTNALSRFEITQLPIMNMITSILKGNFVLGKNYVSQLKAKFTGIVDYSILVAFLIFWFDYLTTEDVSIEDIPQCIPPFLTRGFFNYGLLADGESIVVQATFRLISKFINFCKGVFESHSIHYDDGYCDFTEVMDILPEFRTVINSKPVEKNNEQKQTDIRLNIKTNKRPLVSNSLNKILDQTSLDLILNITRDCDDILVDWLTCINSIVHFVGISDIKGLYDPCKLLKDPVLGKTVSTISSMFEGDLSVNRENVAKMMQRDMALCGTLYLLGFGNFTDVMTFGKVQNTVFRHLLSRFLGLQKIVNRNMTEEGYHKKCLDFISNILRNTRLFSEPIDGWILGITNKDHYNTFLFLLNICLEKPLDILLDAVGNLENRTFTAYVCFECTIQKAFTGSLFMKCAMDFLLHLNTDSIHDFKCTKCGTRALNLVKMLKSQFKELDLVSSRDWIISISSLESWNNGYELKKFGIEQRPCIRQNAPMIETIQDETETLNDIPEHSSLLIYSQLKDAAVKDNNGCLATHVKILIDIISCKLFGNSKMESALSQKWNNNHLYLKYQKESLGNCFTILFLQCKNLADKCKSFKSFNAPALYTLDSTLPIPFHIRLQLLYIAKRTIKDFSISDYLDDFPDLSLGQVLSALEQGDLYEAHLIALDILILELYKPTQDVVLEQFQILMSIIISLENCEKCNNAMDCKLSFATTLFDIGTFLAVRLSNIKVCAKALQSKAIFKWIKIVFSNSYFFIGDAVETRLEKALLIFVLSMQTQLLDNKGVVVGIRKKRIYNIIKVLASRHVCSLYECDLLISKVIIGFVDLVSGVIGDFSTMLKLPQFKDFVCAADIKERQGDIKCHSEIHGWGMPTSVVQFLLHDSNCLSLNAKRVSLTFANFVSDNCSNYSTISETFSMLSMLYPPKLSTWSQGNVDMLLETSKSLQKVLGCSNKVIENIILGEPYIYNVNYLIPLLVGRLYMLLHDQLLKYNMKYEQVFREMVCTEDTRSFNFIASPTKADIQQAANRLNHQCSMLDTDIVFEEEFTSQTPSMIAMNGALEFCILALPCPQLKHYGMQGLGIIKRLFENIFDAALLDFQKSARLEFKSLPQLHCIIYYLQRCLLQSKSIESTPIGQVVFSALAIGKVINVDKALFGNINKIIGRLRVHVDSIPLFYECINSQDPKTSSSQMKFALDIVQSSVRFGGQNQIDKAQIFKVIMTRAINATNQDKAHVLRIFLDAASQTKFIKSLHSLQIFTWISEMAKQSTSTSTAPNDIVWNNLHLHLQTRIWFALVGSLRINENNPAVTVDQTLPIIDSYQCLVRAYEVIGKLTRQSTHGQELYLNMLNNTMRKLSRELKWLHNYIGYPLAAFE